MTGYEVNSYAIPLHPACELSIIMSASFYRWAIICSEHLKLFSMATQFWPWRPHPPLFSFPCPQFPCCLTPQTTWESGVRLTPTWQGLTPSWCQVHPDLTGHGLPAWLWAGSTLPASACCAISLFSPDARSHGESPWQEIEVFCAVKNHRRPCFEFFTPTSVQRCWSHSHLPDSRVGQLMRVLLDLDLGELERASLVHCDRLLLPGPW